MIMKPTSVFHRRTNVHIASETQEPLLFLAVSGTDVTTFSWEAFHSRKHMYNHLILTAGREGHAPSLIETMTGEREVASLGEVCVHLCLWGHMWKQGPMV